ncbi:hypothetical protein [Paraliomyxa miuraensis]|uniref:hypothetical protein n=1 Tax=Paraliomyxa miuraensis TaxID=376150 RepID=UPI002253EDED|nr:hypothetical protein [Paraliomyxa miuraensis]MCX4244441.1 hypothetical protein [Paraliomyxa miuraensis]
MLLSAWILAVALALEPDASSSLESDGGSREAAAENAGPTPRPTKAEGTARLVLGPELRGSVSVVDEQGREVAVVVLRPERRAVVEVPAGRYTLRDPSGETVATVEVEADQVRAVELPSAYQESATSSSAPRVGPASGPAVVTGRLTEDPEGSSTSPAASQVELVRRRRRWARWAAPLLSAVVPGGGQALNGQPGRGLAVFTGTAGLVLGTIAVAGARDPFGGAGGASTRSNAAEIARLGALSGLSTAAGLLYIGQILDAHAQAVDRRPPRPHVGHAVALELSRFETVAFGPGRPAYQLHSDWSIAIMGQIAPRVTLGLSDASIKLGRERDRVTVQAGARAAYRFYDRRRVWLSAGGGALLQGTRADPAAEPLTVDPDAPTPATERTFCVAPYAMLDARLFLLDRWSLGLVPRVSVPLASARRTNEWGVGGHAIPRNAVTFELGANLGVYF